MCKQTVIKKTQNRHNSYIKRKEKFVFRKRVRSMFQLHSDFVYTRRIRELMRKRE